MNTHPSAGPGQTCEAIILLLSSCQLESEWQTCDDTGASVGSLPSEAAQRHQREDNFCVALSSQAVVAVLFFNNHIAKSIALACI